MTGPFTRGEHLDPHDVVGYIDGTLDPAARTRVEAHVSDCEECTGELAAVSRLRPTPRRRIPWLGMGAAAAAVLAAVLVGPRVGQRADDDAPPVRGDSAATMSVVAPADGATLGELPEFAWRPMPGATTYRVSVTGADGDSIWAVTTRDTAVRPSESAVQPRSGVYYWYVDALLADGGSIAGTAHEFRLTQ